MRTPNIMLLHLHVPSVEVALGMFTRYLAYFVIWKQLPVIECFKLNALEKATVYESSITTTCIR